MNRKMNRQFVQGDQMAPAASKRDRLGRLATAASAPAAARPHFRIDWRQLTYYHNESRTSGHLGSSLLARLPCRRRAKTVRPGDQFDDEPATAPLGRKRILNSLDGCFKSGQLNAILGPSGAGKSTFLSALFGNKQDASFGHTKVTWLTPDNELETRPVDQRRTIRIASLPQQDHLLNHLTVYEALMFASKIKNPLQADNKQFHRWNVKRVAKMLKLTDCFGTRCGRLSGGQYKRVSIGQELLSEPDVIILDEPTSGLDAMTCLTTIRTLKSIVTKHPICIILTIHQPDIDVFNLFDQIYVIAQGGMAIYEGPPNEVAPTLARVNLFMPHEAYNPARFIVENAFVADLESSSSLEQFAAAATPGASNQAAPLAGAATSSSDDDEDEDDEPEAAGRDLLEVSQPTNWFKRSMSSLTEALGGAASPGQPGVELKPAGASGKFRDSGRRPLLNIAIQTADGKLITSDALQMERKQQQLNELRAKELASRLSLLRRLNELQKAKYYRARLPSSGTGDSKTASPSPGPGHGSASESGSGDHCPTSGSTMSLATTASSTASSSYSEARDSFPLDNDDDDENVHGQGHYHGNHMGQVQGRNHDETAIRMNAHGGADRTNSSPASRTNFSTRWRGGADGGDGGQANKVRRFDKRLSAKHSQARSQHPTWYHTFLLTHRTWLSIVRDPVFFGIQLTMHTTIPILLALIFGSQQEEGCPEVGNFDLVEFAYQPDHSDFIAASMRSIRQSIGNIGIIFFEMFVLSFAINCITALVFPLDMHVLLKEHRNGWYSLRAYFFGRTLAELPVPIVLHSIAMTILYYLTGQPFTWWRFGGVIVIVILASLVSQSVGLTIGALLMRSSQSAVLAAAGIVAPFFALSGFIVRINTLPSLAQMFANTSYLYHLLNAFIILRYGFDRCPCNEEDFERAEAHKIPSNLKTMASMWIGTYSNEFEASSVRALSAANQVTDQANRTNVDPNIDIIDKLMGAFKMANSFGHRVDTCADVIPYAMLDFNLRDSDLLYSCMALVLMLVLSRFATFSAIYYKIRSFS